MFLYRALPTIDGTLSVMILVARCVVFSHYRLGEAVGGFDDDPSALAGVPFMNRLHPLLPETSNR
jgi:hypothetical protein